MDETKSAYRYNEKSVEQIGRIMNENMNQEKQKNNIFTRIIFGFVWLIIIYLTTNMIIGGIIGGITGSQTNSYGYGYNAGYAASTSFFNKFGIYIMIIQILLTAILSFFGILPGTGKFKKRNK
jgi:hypothetical protein